MEGLILNLVSGVVGGNVVERLIGSLNQRGSYQLNRGNFGRWSGWINFGDAWRTRYGQNGR